MEHFENLIDVDYFYTNLVDTLSSKDWKMICYYKGFVPTRFGLWSRDRFVLYFEKDNKGLRMHFKSKNMGRNNELLDIVIYEIVSDHWKEKERIIIKDISIKSDTDMFGWVEEFKEG